MNMSAGMDRNDFASIRPVGVGHPEGDAGRSAASPLATNLTHTSVGPRAFDRYATHLPSGEMAGAHSRAGPLVSRRIREKDGPGTSTTVRDPIHFPTKAAASAVTSEPTTNAAMDALVRLAGAGGATTSVAVLLTASSISIRASA